MIDQVQNNPQASHWMVLAARAAAATSRRESFMGRMFRVVPAVLVRSQVLHNNIGHVLLSEGSITNEWAEMWNGVPVLVGDHPSRNGEPISGRDPDVLNARGVGWIFAASADTRDGARRLRAEVWLDETRAEAVPELRSILAHLDAGNPVELSTGFPAVLDEREGMHDGQNYEGVIQPVGVDHLVIAMALTGACSVNDGCGLGVNRHKPTAPATTMVVQEQDTKSMDNTSTNETPSGSWFANLFKRPVRRAPEEVWSDNVRRIAERYVISAAATFNGLPVSDQDWRSSLLSALQDQFGAADRQVALEDVFRDEKQAVFWLMTSAGPEPSGGEFFRTTYKEPEEGVFKFDEPERVRRKTAYEPLTDAANTAGCSKCGGECDCGNHPVVNTDQPEGTIMKEETTSTETQEAAGTIQTPPKAPATPTPPKVPAVVANEEAPNTDKSVGDPAPAWAQGLIDQVSSLSTEVAAMKATTDNIPALAERVDAIHSAAASTLKAQEEERKGLVEKLVIQFAGAISEEELKAKSTEDLRKLVSATMGANFVARGGPRTTAINADSGEVQYLPPVPYWKKESKDNQQTA